MNYISIEALSYALQLAEVGCSWSSSPSQPPCSRAPEFLVIDATRVSTGGTIEAAPAWRCREHLELELGHPADKPPAFRRIENPEA